MSLHTESRNEEELRFSQREEAEYDEYEEQMIDESEAKQSANITVSSTRDKSGMTPDPEEEIDEESLAIEEEEENRSILKEDSIPQEEEELSDIPKEQVQSFNSPIKPTRPAPGTPQAYSILESDSDTLMQNQEISVMELDDYSQLEEKKSLATEFRNLGDSIIDRYWSEIEGLEIPRLNRESKMMVTFRPNRFVKLQKAMTERFNAIKAEGKDGMITFKRNDVL